MKTQKYKLIKLALFNHKTEDWEWNGLYNVTDDDLDCVWEQIRGEQE